MKVGGMMHIMFALPVQDKIKWIWNWNHVYHVRFGLNNIKQSEFKIGITNYSIWLCLSKQMGHVSLHLIRWFSMIMI